MTDHDRGAYTPPTDEALAFDARRQSERRPVPMTLVGSAVVLVVLIVGVAVVYRGGVRGVDEAPRPIGQPVVSVKTAPPTALAANSVSAPDDGESKPVVAATSPPPAATPATPTTAAATAPAPAPVKAKPAVKVASASDKPTFAPAPEQPAPRPEPAAKTLALLDQPGQTVGPGRVRVTPPPGKPIRTVGGLDASEVAAAGMTGAAPSHTAPAPSPSAAPVKVATATPTVAKPRPTATKSAATAAGPKSIDAALANSSQVTGGPVVQIGAFSSAALSDQGYADVSRIMVGQMVGKAKHVMTVDHAGSTLFRTWVSGFTTRAQAQAFCTALKAHSKPCFVKG